MVVANRRELIAATATPGAVAFVDFDTLDHIAQGPIEAPIVAIMEHAPADALAKTIRSLDAFPWLSHILGASMLSTPRAAHHLSLLLTRIACGTEGSMLGGPGVGRVALLARASRREARFERMRAFFAQHGVSRRTIETIVDVADELVMNALYDAPVEAGFFDRPKQRTEDVALPPDHACEISYGLEGDTAFVRLRDGFGALTRSRLIEVLNRCSSHAVELDESRGGAGLGLWRVFSAASTIAITVVPGCVTEFLVGFTTKDGRRTTKPAAVHLFLDKKCSEKSDPDLEDDVGLDDQSFALVLVA